MKFNTILPMGCLSSRPATVAPGSNTPSNMTGPKVHTTKRQTNTHNDERQFNSRDKTDMELEENRTEADIEGDEESNKIQDEQSSSQRSIGRENADGQSVASSNDNLTKDTNENSFDVELDVNLLRQYVTVDTEIQHLEDRDALRIYHEKIDQLEQLERELDMISTEAEEMAVRSETNTQPGLHSNGGMNEVSKQMRTGDTENASLLSGVTDSLSPKSSMFAPKRSQANTTNSDIMSNPNKSPAENAADESSTKGQRSINERSSAKTKTANSVSGGFKNISYSTVEDVFSRKILLEKERDKLKRDVELVIIECDKLQQRYRKRDEILDKLFDGRTGNGLENHLEQQLNWLLEQKHYVDQVFYAWKRAETLTSQTCEQFATALELIKRLPKIQEDQQRQELAKSATNLLIKSRKDMEQAQKYNPNVDAPFFTENETERFDKIIELISSNTIGPSDYSQTITVIQFAYKRAVSIRLWLEQILQITIARDSFELAEEYKWIAIQLRKERINLIKSKLQDPQYQMIVREVQDQVSRQRSMSDKRRQQQQQQQNQRNNMKQQDPKAEVNRDSGVESVDIDIEEEIYRLLESNRARLAQQTNGPSTNPALNSNEPGGPVKRPPQFDQQLGTDNPNDSDQIMRDRIQRRAAGGQPLASLNEVLPPVANEIIESGQTPSHSASTMGTTPSKLRIELDEEARQSLLKQVDQIHSMHKIRLERIRGSNRARAANSMLLRMQQAKQQKQRKHHSRTGSKDAAAAALSETG